MVTASTLGGERFVGQVAVGVGVWVLEGDQRVLRINADLEQLAGALVGDRD